MKKAREAAYSDEEYDDLSEFQRRRRRGPRSKGDGNQESWDRMTNDRQFDMGQSDSSQQQEFWNQANKEGNRSSWNKNNAD